MPSDMTFAEKLEAAGMEPLRAAGVGLARGWPDKAL